MVPQADPDMVQSWLGTGYGVVVVAILTALVAPWIMEWIKGSFSKKLETHKLNLKRAEMLFEREILAANEFIALHEKLKPTFLPGMDSYDAVVGFAGRLDSAESRLRKFKVQHGAILEQKVRVLLDEAINLADEHKFDEIFHSQSPDPQYFEPQKETLNAAGDVLKKIAQIEQALIIKIKEP